jgi:phosphoribosylformimino-5-aminoimidazole carboxamide ribotide isomerase
LTPPGAITDAVSIPVIASGGVSSPEDLGVLKTCGAPLDGVISGRTLYDGRIDVAVAVSVLAG